MTVGRHLVLPAVGLAAALGAAIALPYVADRFIVNVATLALTFALLALSINLLGGYAGLASLGHAGIMAVAAYGLAVVALDGGGVVAQVTVALLLGVLTGGLFGILSMRTSGVYFLMATLAQGMVVWGLSIRLTSVTGGENGLRGLERPALVEPYWALYYLAVAVVVLGIAAMWVITRSPFGLVLRGVEGNEARLAMLGYAVNRFKVAAFMLSGVLAGAAGVLFAYYNRFVSPSAAGFLTSGKAVLMVLLGGAGTLLGPVVGALLITAVENVMSLHTERWPTVLGLLYILTVLFAPQGLMGLGRDLVARLRPARPGATPGPAPPDEPTPDPPPPASLDAIGGRQPARQGDGQ